MTFNEYQQAAGRTRSTKYHPGDKTSMMISALGMCGEAGELAEQVKKFVAHGHALDTDKVFKEIGDVLWYVAEACSCFGFHLQDVAEANIAKLKERYPEGFSAERSINRDDGVVRK